MYRMGVDRLWSFSLRDLSLLICLPWYWFGSWSFCISPLGVSRFGFLQVLFLELIVYDLSNSTFPFSDLSAYRWNLVFILIHYCGATAMTGDRCPTKTLQSWCVNVAVMLRVGFLCPLSLLLWCHLQVFLEVFIVSNFLSFYHKPVKASPLAWPLAWPILP